MNAPAPATAIPARRPLDDWLSPILVKELRQGMRARVFVVFFLLVQVFLFMLMLGNVAAGDDRNALQTQNVFFWVIVGFALLVLMPLRSLVALSSETKNRTMETILLTRLTAWRVVFGKWTALFGQSLLFVSAVLPYVVLRYFIGGQDVVYDLLWILFLLWLSGLFIAIGISVSGMGNMIVRVVMLIGLVIAMVNTLDLFPRGWSTFGSAWEMIGWLVDFGVFLPALLFELSASSIAPASENHAIWRRLLALLFFAASYGLHRAFPGTNITPAVVIPLVILIGICYYELAEKPKLNPRVVDSLARKGIPGTIAALFLLPGWPSALLFSLLVLPPALSVALPLDTNVGWMLPILAVFGSILPPIFVCHVFFPKLNQVLLMVLLYNAFLMALTSFLAGIASVVHNGAYLQLGKLFAFLPSLPTLYISTTIDPQFVNNSAGWFHFGHPIVVALFTLLLLGGSAGYYRELRALYRRVRERKVTA